MARRLSDPATTVQVLTLVEQPLEAPPTLDERVADTTEALALAEVLEDPIRLYFAALYRRISAMQTGDFGHSTRCLELMQSLTEKLRQPILMWITKFHEAAEALVVGDHGQAEQLTTEALQIGTDCGQPDAVSFYGSQMVIVRHQQGRLGEFLPVIASVATEMSAMPAFMGAVAAAHLDAGEEHEALALLEGAAADGFTSLPMDIGWLDGVTGYAEVAIELHVVNPAALLLDLLASYHDQVGYNGLMPLEPVAHYLGGLASVLGRWEESEAYFVESTGLNKQGGCHVLQRPNQSLMGKDAWKTPSSWRHRQGPGPAHHGAYHRNRSRIRGSGATCRRRSPTLGLSPVRRSGNAGLASLHLP